MAKRHKCIIIIILVIVFMASMSACSGSKQGNVVELSETEMDSLMTQVAESDVNLGYGEYLIDEAYAVAEVFGILRDGDRGTAYVYLNEGDFVVFKGKAYNMSGSAGEVIIRFNYTDIGVTLSEVEWSADGGLHEDWMKENFPSKYLKRAKTYNPHDTNGDSILGAQLKGKAEVALGVPVESDNLLEIDTDKGTYKIIKTTDGPDGTLDIETIEQGKLGKELF